MELNQVTLSVTDIERAVVFYRRLGLRQIVGSSHYARFECRPEGASLSVHASDREVDPNGVTIYFECEDLDVRVARLRREGVAFDSDPTDQEWLWREAHLRDPDGNRLCLYYAGENRLNPPWRLQSEEAP